MKKYIVLMIVLYASISCAFDLRITGDRLSIKANQVPLQNILQKLAVTGIKIQIDPRINPNISASFQDRYIEDAIKTILKTLDYVLIWESVKGLPNGFIRLAEVQIFESGRKNMMKPLGKPSVFSISRNPKDGSLFVKGEILIRLEPGTDSLQFKKILKEVGGTVTASNPELGIYNIRLPENADVTAISERISKYPGVATSEPNHAFPISNPYRYISIGKIATDATDKTLIMGKAPVAVLDTGFSPEWGNDFILASLDAVNPDQSISDNLGHGTQMALIASGVVRPYGADISDTCNPVIPIKAFDDNGFTSNFSIMNSINFALENNARVMSLSWGSEKRSDFLEDAIKYASSKGLTIVASAGNSPTGRPIYPAGYNSVIAVGALEPDGTVWKNSNHGEFIDLYAPGFATLPVGYKGDPGIYAGTSISASFIANQIGNYLFHNPEATRQDILNFLKSSSPKN